MWIRLDHPRWEINSTYANKLPSAKVILYYSLLCEIVKDRHCYSNDMQKRIAGRDGGVGFVFSIRWLVVYYRRKYCCCRWNPVRFLIRIIIIFQLHLFSFRPTISISLSFGYNILEYSFIIQNLLTGNTNVNSKAICVFMCCFVSMII